jgi:hypothetical protein
LVSCVHVTLQLEAELFIELNVLILTEERNFLALVFPTFILEQLNDNLAVTFSPYRLASHNILNLSHSTERCFTQQYTPKGYKFFGYKILAYNINVMGVGVGHET